MSNSKDSKKTVEFTRLFDAPRELVFEMFTMEQHITKWWGPKGFTNPNTKLDVRVNGDVWLDMMWPDGTLIYNRGEYLEIDKPNKLVFVLRALKDSRGVPQLETHNTFVFSDEGDKTKMHMIAIVTKSNANTVDAISGMYQGWSESLDKLERTVSEAIKEQT